MGERSKPIFLQIQGPGMTTECPLGIFLAYWATLEELRLQLSSLFFFGLPTMSLYIHMKMMRSLKSFGRTLKFLLHHVFGLHGGASGVVRPGKIFHSSTTGFPLILSGLTTRSRVSKPLNFVRPRVYRLWIFCDSASDILHRNRKDVYFCC